MDTPGFRLTPGTACEASAPRAQSVSRPLAEAQPGPGKARAALKLRSTAPCWAPGAWTRLCLQPVRSRGLPAVWLWTIFPFDFSIPCSAFSLPSSCSLAFTAFLIRVCLLALLFSLAIVFSSSFILNPSSFPYSSNSFLLFSVFHLCPSYCFYPTHFLFCLCFCCCFVFLLVFFILSFPLSFLLSSIVPKSLFPGSIEAELS